MPLTSPLPASAAKWRLAIWSLAGVVMLVPVIARLTLAEMNWDTFDFAVFGAMLLAGCLGFEVVLRLGTANTAYRIAACLAIGGAFLMVMANLAVGIIGNENNPVNLLFFALLALGAVGALTVRFDAAGMARVMALLAAAQALLGVGLAVTGAGFTPVFTLFYVLLWLAVAALFRKAGRTAG
ncbi:hypothetical protein [Novosphingobium sp.]|uniref:hypothetical protein n=1 Tax=Novosphingobium sp. TaxID=1874826 RepID=UPI00273725B4|nr:hypothetical protein [Novosphingobium sp.]MDP3908108.1 hypothetical protein [Novosphingobium sp.]